VKFNVAPFHPDQFAAWNKFVKKSNEGTLFHDLNFLAYHGDRFNKQEHHLIIYKGSSLYSVMPLAIFEENDRRVAKSPYGGSYGGPVFIDPQNYQDSLEIIWSILNYLKQKNVDELQLTLPVSACYCKYSETFRLALMESGFDCINRDISSAVCLETGKAVAKAMTSRARNMARKAQKLSVEVVRRASVKDFWYVMNATFEKHGTKPTHTASEFFCLHERMPERIYVDVAYLEKTPIAGTGYFIINNRVKNAFYFCQDPQRQQLQALSLLIHDALIQAQLEGYRWFDFGTSSVNMQGRSNIFRFKESFGAIGIFRETYKGQTKTVLKD